MRVPPENHIYRAMAKTSVINREELADLVSRQRHRQA
jgi:DNA-binding CsgD family transcriptional regulator